MVGGGWHTCVGGGRGGKGGVIKSGCNHRVPCVSVPCVCLLGFVCDRSPTLPKLNVFLVLELLTLGPSDEMNVGTRNGRSSTHAVFILFFLFEPAEYFAWWLWL